MTSRLCSQTTSNIFHRNRLGENLSWRTIIVRTDSNKRLVNQMATLIPCGRCGQPIFSDAKVCRHCKTTDINPPPENKFGPVHWVVLAVLIILLPGAIYFYMRPAQTVQGASGPTLASEEADSGYPHLNTSVMLWLDKGAMLCPSQQSLDASRIGGRNDCKINDEEMVTSVVSAVAGPTDVDYEVGMLGAIVGWVARRDLTNTPPD
jgi:hypothetical protein